jgi:FeoB-associated Cys-rich membrane protein
MFQQLVVGAIVLAAIAFIVQKVRRAVVAARAPAGAGCDSGCGCAAPSSSSAQHVRE